MSIVSRSDWGARSATNRTAVPASSRTSFVVHYDGGTPIPVPADETGCAAQMRQTQAYHMDGNGWADIGYNFVICQHGTVWEGRGWDVLGAHAGATGNVAGIGVQVHIGGAQEPTEAALGAVRWLKEQADGRFHRTLAWKGHRDYMATSCPGEILYGWVRSGAPGGTGGAPAPTPSWDGVAFPGAGAFVLGQSHPAVTLLGQRLVAHGWAGYSAGPGPEFTTTDKAGVTWFQTAQGWTGADADGIPGPVTWERLMAPPGAVPVSTPAAVPVLNLEHVIAATRLDAAPTNPTGRIHYGDPAGALALERALADIGLNPGPLDGSLGTSFQRAYAALQRSMGYTGSAADGIPGRKSLTYLGARTGRFTVA